MSLYSLIFNAFYVHVRILAVAIVAHEDWQTGAITKTCNFDLLFTEKVANTSFQAKASYNITTTCRHDQAGPELMLHKLKHLPIKDNTKNSENEFGEVFEEFDIPYWIIRTTMLGMQVSECEVFPSWQEFYYQASNVGLKTRVTAKGGCHYAEIFQDVVRVWKISEEGGMLAAFSTWFSGAYDCAKNERKRIFLDWLENLPKCVSAPMTVESLQNHCVDKFSLLSAYILAQWKNRFSCLPQEALVVELAKDFDAPFSLSKG